MKNFWNNKLVISALESDECTRCVPKGLERYTEHSECMKTGGWTKMIDYIGNLSFLLPIGSVLGELPESHPWLFIFIENGWVQAENGRVQLDISENNWFRMVSDQIRVSTVWVKNADRKERGEERNERKATWKAVWTASGILLSHYFHSKLHSRLFSLEVANHHSEPSWPPGNTNTIKIITRSLPGLLGTRIRAKSSLGAFLTSWEHEYEQKHHSERSWPPGNTKTSKTGVDFDAIRLLRELWGASKPKFCRLQVEFPDFLE